MKYEAPYKMFNLPTKLCMCNIKEKYLALHFVYTLF